MPDPIHIIEVDDDVQPDNSFPNAHAIYLKLSAEPTDTWIREFEHVCGLTVATRKRPISVVGSRMRVVIDPTEHLPSVLISIQQAVRSTNERL